MGNQLANIQRLEKDLWEAADNLRANSKLTSTEYCMPVLGVIFLRHAANRFDAVAEEIAASGKKRKPVKADYVKRRALFLPEESRYDYLLNLPSDTDLGEAVNTAMDKIEESFEPLAGVLPREYGIFEKDVLEDLLRVFDSEAMKSATGDVFGRIYEYFLMKFAMQGAQDNGEFFTPPSLVQTIVNVIEPSRGVVLDPAVGSAGMFVQSSHFVEAMGQDAAHNLTFYGQEKTATTIRLAKMNLAVHGLEGDIVEANTFYDDEHDLLGKCDYVMANPPFNVDKVDAEKIKGDVRLPFGLPGVNKKKKVSNGNYLWIQYFYSYLNKKGRSGFVMASSASDAGGEDKNVRQKLVESGHVDVMIAIGTNFFYTRTLPCMLWFFDKGKPKKRTDSVLMIDARTIARKVTRVINDFSPEQLSNIASIVWLHRGEEDRFFSLLTSYLRRAVDTIPTAMKTLEEASESLASLVEKLAFFSQAMKKNKDLESDTREGLLHLSIEATSSLATFEHEHKKAKDHVKKVTKGLNPASVKTISSVGKSANKLSEIASLYRSLRKLFDSCIRSASACHEFASKNFDVSKEQSWDNANLRKLHRELLRSTREGEEGNLKINLHEALHLPCYFYRQLHLMIERFPKGKYRDIEGLCRSVNIKTIEENGWSLTPGRYVGFAMPEEDDDFSFDDEVDRLFEELTALDATSKKLTASILHDLDEIRQ